MLNDIENQYDKIYRYCFVKLHNAQTAEDITQDTFLRYYSINEKTEIKNPTAYLYTIARNLCTDYYRAMPVEVIDDMDVICMDDCEKSNVQLALTQAMEELPDTEREIIFLRYTNDVSVNEIARILGLSRFAVYRKEQHALKELKKFLDRGDFYD